MDSLHYKKTYYIPPKLHRDYLLAGFTILELILFLILGFAGFFLALRGYSVALLIPAVLLVLHCRAFPDGKNVRQVLTMRWRYFRKEQNYSLQECDRKK